jgi:amidophosphoribosyltransferase
MNFNSTNTDFYIPGKHGITPIPVVAVREEPFNRSSMLHEKCGIFGVVLGPKSKLNFGNGAFLPELIKQGISSLFHRGADSSGVVISPNDGVKLQTRIGLGRYVSNLDSKYTQSFSVGEIGSAHCRYATTGDSKEISNAQPMKGECIIDGKKIEFTISHNGNLTNTENLLKYLKGKNITPYASSDTAVLVSLIELLSTEKNYSDLLSLIRDALAKVDGAYCLLIQSHDSLIAARDPYGVRPLALGRFEDSYVLSSETCAFESVKINGVTQIEYLREIIPGEITLFQSGKEPVTTYNNRSVSTKATRFCGLEFVYLMKEDSIVHGITVKEWRQLFGQQVAKEFLTKNPNLVDKIDFVSGMPKSGLPGAKGVFEILFKSNDSTRELDVLVTNPDFYRQNSEQVRSFLQATPESRQKIGNEKLLLNEKIDPSNLKGKILVICDDSLVRGNAFLRAYAKFSNLELKEVHLVLNFPRVLFPCHYGVNIASQNELIAYQYPDDKQLAEHLGVASVTFLSLEGFEKVANDNGVYVCLGCASGDYGMPTPCLD